MTAPVDRMSEQALLSHLLETYSGHELGLPAAPRHVVEREAATAAAIDGLASQIGAHAESDYFVCSKQRFSHILLLARVHLPPPARLLDVGNAPGFLGLALANAGFEIDGINLSDAWLGTYPDPALVSRFRVRACDIEREVLPYPNGAFDGIVFTEVLEHIAIRSPREILTEFRRVLKPGGKILFSTPNVCNLSNVIALCKGQNVFWKPEIFYGSLDRHNREYTPTEARSLFEECGFRALDFYGMNDHANWRTGAANEIYAFLSSGTPEHPLLRNTIIAVLEST